MLAYICSNSYQFNFSSKTLTLPKGIGLPHTEIVIIYKESLMRNDTLLFAQGYAVLDSIASATPTEECWHLRTSRPFIAHRIVPNTLFNSPPIIPNLYMIEQFSPIEKTLQQVLQLNRRLEAEVSLFILDEHTTLDMIDLHDARIAFHLTDDVFLKLALHRKKIWLGKTEQSFYEKFQFKIAYWKAYSNFNPGYPQNIPSFEDTRTKEDKD